MTKTGGLLLPLRQGGRNSLNAVTVSYSTIKAVSEPDAIAELLATEVITPVLPSIQIKKVRTREGRRFEAPRVLWNVYEAALELPGRIEAKKLFWTKTFFDNAEFELYRSRVERLVVKQNGNPLDSGGYVHVFNDLNMFLFFFPMDPVFPALGTYFDSVQALPLLVPHFERLRQGAAISELRPQLVKYLPEISLIVRFDGEVGEERPLSIYGKFQHSRRGQLTYEVMRALWESPARASGELVVAEPLGYYPKHDLLLQSALPGEEIPSDRHADLFMAQCEAAGRTLGHIHKSAITVGAPHTIDTEIGRLRGRLEEFKVSGPKVYMLFRDLLSQISAKAERVPAEAPVPSHGDYKYNQFLYDGTSFGLIDVEYFVRAEPSFDLGKYCGHLAPSMPKHWSDTVQANEARRIFLETYCNVRPEYRGTRFNLYEALSLATRALVVLWSQPRNWQYTSETLIALAFERLKTRWGE